MIAIPFLDSFRFVSEMVRHQRQSRQREREREIKDLRSKINDEMMKLLIDFDSVPWTS